LAPRIENDTNPLGIKCYNDNIIINPNLMTKSREDYSESLESQYRRMERVHDKIIADFESTTFSKSSQERLDDVYDFLLTCYHLREWVREDGKVDKTIKDKLPTFENHNSPVQFQMCRDLCNKSKHAVLKYKPNDPDTKIVPYGGSIFKASTKEIKEAQKRKETLHLKEEEGIFMGNYLVTFKGNQYDLKGVVQGCMHVWKDFFEKNDLLLPKSTPYKS
jgi:hypothetical protein